MAQTKKYGKPRQSGEPSIATERKIRIMLELIRNKNVRLEALEVDYGIAERSLLRDFQELRRIGERAGFHISEKAVNGRMQLTDFDARPTQLDQGGKKLYALIRGVAKALGKPVEAEVESLAEQAPRDEATFLRFLMPTLVDGTAVTETFKALEGAWRSNARVRFKYAGKERRVEPYAVIVRSGRYYLLGRDLDAKDDGWRHFALDRIAGTVGRAGSFTPRAVPEEILAPDSIGWMSLSGKKRIEVQVWISAALAPSAASRQWQRGQRVERCDDGSVVLTLATGDMDEVIRWAFGFGKDARVVGPQDAVERARALLDDIRTGYGEGRSRKRP